MIRPATFLDVPALLAMGHRMHAESPHFSRIAFSRERLEQTLLAVLDSRDGFLWVAEREGELVGVMVGIAIQHWCSSDLMATELALFVEEQHRGSLIAARLVKQFLAWARAAGCVQVTAGVSTGVNVKSTTALYERLGFKQFGTQLEVTWESQ